MNILKKISDWQQEMKAKRPNLFKDVLMKPYGRKVLFILTFLVIFLILIKMF